MADHTPLPEHPAAAQFARLMQIVRTAARDLIKSDGVALVFRDRNECFYVEEDAIGPLWKGKRFPLTACVSGWAMLNRQAAIIPDIFNDPRVPVEAYRPTFVRSMAMVPVGGDEPFAAIGAYWATPHEATQSEIETLMALADSASIEASDPAHTPRP